MVSFIKPYFTLPIKLFLSYLALPLSASVLESYFVMQNNTCFIVLPLQHVRPVCFKSLKMQFLEIVKCQ